MLAYVPPHAAPAFVVDAGLAPAGGWVKVDPKTLATPFERVWAVGDVTGIPLPNGKSLPKAGVFAEGQADVVARNIAALVRGAAPAAEFGGEGACFVEMGGGRAGFATGNFYATPDPVVPAQDARAAVALGESAIRTDLVPAVALGGGRRSRWRRVRPCREAGLICSCQRWS